MAYPNGTTLGTSTLSIMTCSTSTLRILANLLHPTYNVILGATLFPFMLSDIVLSVVMLRKISLRNCLECNNPECNIPERSNPEHT